MALVNSSVVDITADTLLSQSKTKIKGNDDKLLANDVAVEARLVTAEGNITTLTAQKAPIANPTFTGTVTTPKAVITPEGGIAISLINKTGSASVKGACVTASDTTDFAFKLQTDEFSAIGFVYTAGVADGAACLVVVAGIAEALLKDTTASTKGYWAFNSATDGRIETKAAPVNDAEHFREAGHCIESKVAGTDVLCKIITHFN